MTVLVGGIQKFSTEDGPGIRTTVFLKGCPLKCQWCHNPELIEPAQQLIRMPNSCIHCGWCLDHCEQKAIYVDVEKKVDIHRDLCNLCGACISGCYANALQLVAKPMTAEEIMAEVLQDQGFYQHSGGGMTISGGEMLTHPEMVKKLLDMAEKEQIGVCLDTSGYGDGAVLESLVMHPAVTNVLFDMKSIDNAVHQEYTGVSNERILANLIRLSENAVTHDKILMRMPLVHDVNDTPEIIRATGQFYKEHGIRALTLLTYHNLGVSKLRNIGGEPRQFTPPSEQRLQEIFRYFKDDIGMNVEILGRA